MILTFALTSLAALNVAIGVVQGDWWNWLIGGVCLGVAAGRWWPSAPRGVVRELREARAVLGEVQEQKNAIAAAYLDRITHPRCDFGGDHGHTHDAGVDLRDQWTFSSPPEMTALWACSCSLHPRKVHTDPCRLCISKHPASRSAHREPSAVTGSNAQELDGLNEASERVCTAAPESRTGSVASTDPALASASRTVRARTGGQVGSPIQGRSVEPVPPDPRSTPAPSGSRST